MANVIRKATNKFTKGLVMDFSPENTKNEVLTHALNATLLTFNGNELSLLNDMGNGRVETAFLPEGYIPVGVCEYGGIIYIVSYNPLEDKSQIGCFPSPERNVSLDELGNYENISITYKNFLKTIKLDKDNKDGNNDEDELITGDINLQSTVVLLRNSNINPGDKFIVYTNDDLKNEKLQDYEIEDHEHKFNKCQNPIIKLSIVSIEDSGRIKYLNNDLRKYINTHNTISESGIKITSKTRYHIPKQKDVNIDKYRDILSSGYNIFKEKTSGKLAILAELITIDAFSVTHSIRPSKSVETIIKTDLVDGKELEYNIELYSFDVFLHFDVMPLLDVNTYDFNPKLAFYQLNNSKLLMLISENTEQVKSLDTIKLQDIIVTDNSELDKKLKLLNFSDLKFLVPENKSFHQSLEITNNDDDECEYIYLENNKHYILNGKLSKLFQGKVYELTDELTDELEEITKIEDDTLYRFTSTANLYKHIYDFVSILPYNDLTGDYSKYTLYTHVLKCKKSTYIADKDTYSYQDVHLASFKLPKDLVDAGFNFPVKYDYTITPCMEYGKLPHLQVLNIVDLNHLNDFQASNFNIWYYRIDGDQLTLTFGAEVFDTFETYKVDGLVLEFYDWRGFAGSLEITDKKSYSGKFTTIITLNSPGNISNKKINTNKDGYSTDFVHNINIIEEENKYKFGDDYVKYNDNDNEKGWSYLNQENELLNDCGTLYSNIIYGVKPYLRINENGKYKFIKKSDMFLFTLPILNDYCYKVSNFNTLEHPELNLLLTYRIEDSSKVIPYNDDNITDGYSKEDYQNISDYKLGIYSDKNLSVIRYMQYEGTSKLNLEVGLHKDYEKFNLSCDSKINLYFKCDLQLIGTDDKSFQELLNDGESLNTKNISNKDNHYLKFENNESIYPIPNILEYNFITAEKTNSISINYKYLVGYSIDINNITATNIPVTTICALCYKSDTGKYNYEDFEVYETMNYNDIPLYYSNFLFYNTGNSKEFEFGSCRMVDLTATATNLQTIVHRNIIESTDTILKGLLNTGDMLRTICSNIGKLAFCVPHLHTRRDNSYSFNYTDASKYRKNIFDLYEESRQYSMCAVTPTMINHYTKFVDASLDTQGLKYFSPMEVAKFNRCLIKTMLNVYAYNPDITSVYVKIGEISIKDPQPKFTSNLLSMNSRLIKEGDFKGEEDFNKLVKIGSVTVNTYLTDLWKHSEIKETPVVKFKPNFTYCGTKDEYYLISELTYKLPLPNQLYQDLQLESTVFVKHHDGSYDFINGQFDLNSLYGWYPDLKLLVGLDVSNYIIDRNTGKLDIIKDANIISEVYDVLIAFDRELFEYFFGWGGRHETLHVKVMDEEVPITIDSYITAPDIIGFDDYWMYAYKQYYPDPYEPDKVNYSIAISLDYFSNMAITDSNMEILVAYILKSDFLTTSDHDVFDLITKSSFQNMPQGYTYDNIHKGVHLYDELFQNTNSTIYLLGAINEYLHEVSIPQSYIHKELQKLYSLDKTLKIITCEMNFWVPEPVICIYRFRKPNLNVRCANSIPLSNINVSIVPAIKTSKYSYKTLPYRIDDPEHYEVYDIYSNATLVGSSITINDLVYYPENVGHRLFIKDNLYGSLYNGLTLYVDLSDLAILEMDTDGWNRRINYVRNNPDYKNKLTISLGPSYTLLDIKELDPELNSVSIYE